MHDIEAVLDILLSVIAQPPVDPSQGLLHDVLVGIADDADMNEQLSASIHIPEALTAAVDDQSQQRALSCDVASRQRYEVANLPLQEGLEGLVGPANDAEKLDCRCPPGLDLGVAEVVVYIDIGFVFEEREGRLVDRDVGDDEGLEDLVHVLEEEWLHIWPVHEALEELQAV